MRDQLNMRNGVLLMVAIYFGGASKEEEPHGGLEKIAEPGKVYEVELENRVKWNGKHIFKYLGNSKHKFLIITFLYGN